MNTTNSLITNSESIDAVASVLPLADTSSPLHYWINNLQENDVYALNQKHIYIYNSRFSVEPLNYPINIDDNNSVLDKPRLSKTVKLKSKLVWLLWENQTNNFESLEQFRKSMDNSFSIRAQLKNEIKTLFK